MKNLISYEDFLKEDAIKGGFADKHTIESIAKKHGVSVDNIKAQIEKGKKIELEHVDSEDLAAEIAMDHLVEFPDYYDQLEKMEKDAELKKKVVSFLKDNPEPSDEEVHKFASDLGIETDNLEAMLYAIAGKYVKTFESIEIPLSKDASKYFKDEIMFLWDSNDMRLKIITNDKVRKNDPTIWKEIIISDVARNEADEIGKILSELDYSKWAEAIKKAEYKVKVK